MLLAISPCLLPIMYKTPANSDEKRKERKSDDFQRPSVPLRRSRRVIVGAVGAIQLLEEFLCIAFSNAFAASL